MNEKEKAEFIEKLNSEGLSREGTIEAIREETTPDADPQFEISFSSETPVQRFYGMEILGHKSAEIDLEWMNGGTAPLLLDHDPRSQIGVIERAWISKSRGKALVRFGNGTQAQEIRRDVEDGIRRNVSVGYAVHDLKLTSSEAGKPDEFRITRWTPKESSIVALPADASVGVGRNTPAEHETQILEVKQEPEMKTAEELKADNAAQQSALKSAGDAGREMERTRISDITDLCNRHNMGDLAAELVKSGGSLEDARQRILTNFESGAQSVDATVGMSKQEKKDVRGYSFVKAFRQIADGTGLDGVEKEMHDEGCKAARESGMAVTGMAVPMIAMQSRDVTDTTEGTDVTGTDIDSSFIGLLRNRMLVKDMGAKFLTGLTGDIQFPTISGGASAAWEGENDAGSEQTPTFGQVKLTPNRVGAYTEISKQLLIQSTPDVEMMVREDLSTSIALAIDSAALTGPGTGDAPTGITATSGIGSVVGGTNGLAPTWAHIIELETDVASANGDVGSLYYVTSAAVRGKLKQTLRVASTDSVFVWGDGPEPVNGYPASVTNQIGDTYTKGSSSAASYIIFGNMADILVGQWGGLDIVVDPYSLATTNLTRITVNTYADVGIRHAGSFSAMLDALSA